MFKRSVTASVSLRSLPLLAILILAPALARADDFSFDGGGDCSDPSITSDIFPLPATNMHGGLCLAFGNHTGAPITSFKFTTSIPDTNSDPMLCSGGSFFATCGFALDTVDGTITVDFSGIDDRHSGIPNIPPGIDVGPDNFVINLNNPTDCDAAGGNCTQPGDSNGTGDWLKNGNPEIFSAVANGVPEPRAGALLLTVLGALVARIRIARNSNR